MCDANPDYSADAEDNYPLIIALSHNHHALVRKLIECGANVNVMCQDGVTPLMIASSRGDVGIINLLLDSGADIHAR